MSDHAKTAVEILARRPSATGDQGATVVVTTALAYAVLAVNETLRLIHTTLIQLEAQEPA